MITTKEAVTKKQILEALSLRKESIDCQIQITTDNLAITRQGMLRSSTPEILEPGVRQLEEKIHDLRFKQKSIERAMVEINNAFGW